LLDLVEDGEPMVIERHGRPVAQLVPVSERDASALLERLEAELAAVEAMRENIKALIRRAKKRLREYAVKRRDRPA
jgi:prevent-host-death family protein